MGGEMFLEHYFYVEKKLSLKLKCFAETNQFWQNIGRKISDLYVGPIVTFATKRESFTSQSLK